MLDDHTALDPRDEPLIRETNSPSQPKETTRPRQEAPPDQKPRKTRFLVLAVAATIGIAAGTWYYVSTLDIETTDDAQVDGNAVAIAPKVSGYVVSLAVRDNQSVKAGDLILTVDPRDYVAARDQARAALAVAEAQLKNASVSLTMTKVSAPAKLTEARAQVDLAAANRDLADTNNRRQVELDFRATTQQSKDQALSQLRTTQATLANNEAERDVAGLVGETIAQSQAQVDQAQAQVEQAKAQLATAALNLANTEVRAPQDGRVTTRNVQVGSYVQPAQSLLSLVTPDVWITANFKENQLDRMRVGQPVAIRVDAYGHLDLKGHVDSIQGGTGARFSAFPAENATGNFVKIVQRVPVKIVIDSGLDPNLPLPLGASADPSVSLR